MPGKFLEPLLKKLLTLQPEGTSEFALLVMPMILPS
jgi:hypothetical protein